MGDPGRLDAVLINPASRKRVYQSLGKELAAIEPPVWAGLMASFLRAQNRSAVILDAEARDLDPGAVAAEVAAMKPRLAVVVVYGHQPSASTQIMPSAGAVCTALKERAPEVPVLLVGGHVAALPERTLREEAADYVAGGEGLWTMSDLLAALATSHPELSKVRGLHYREGNRVLANVDGPLLDRLDERMCGVAWDLLPMKRYRAHNWHCFGHLKREPYAAVYTTLGCPYKCSFCCIQAPFRNAPDSRGLPLAGDAPNTYRFWSPKRVVDDLEELVVRYGVRNVKFADEMFVLNRRHVEGICDLIIERRLDLNIWAYARVDTIKEGMLPKLRRAGFRWLALGIEAASDKVRDDVDKSYGQDVIFRTLGQIAAEGIHVVANYIFGLPEDDVETMGETLSLAMDVNAEWANFYSAMAYPGSSLYNQAIAAGWKLPDTWGGYSQHSVDSLPLPTRHLTAAEVLRFRDEAFDRYYTSPRYLEMIRAKFGADTVADVQAMTKHKLERRNA
jgi:radical SAM superfamily enzyme YgiQ (UPF0313 family)